MRWHLLAIPTLRKWRQEDCTLNVVLGYIVNLRSAWDRGDHVLKKTTKKKSPNQPTSTTTLKKFCKILILFLLCAFASCFTFFVNYNRAENKNSDSIMLRSEVPSFVADRTVVFIFQMLRDFWVKPFTIHGNHHGLIVTIYILLFLHSHALSKFKDSRMPSLYLFI